MLPLKQKVRSDSVLMCSFIIGSDRNFYIGLTLSEQRQFIEEATEYFAERYGKKNIISAVVHVDETTPHLHLNLIPIAGNKLSAKQTVYKSELAGITDRLSWKIGKRWGLECGKLGSCDQEQRYGLPVRVTDKAKQTKLRSKWCNGYNECISRRIWCSVTEVESKEDTHSEMWRFLMQCCW